MNYENSKCTILINSCDAYSDVWDLFFAGLKVQWPDCTIPIILNTETKNYSNDMGIRVYNYTAKSGKDCWGERYKMALRQIETPYIISILDDFVLREKFTGQKLIESAVKWMDDDPDIGVFYIYKHPNVIQKETEYEGFGLMPQECEYKLTTAVAVWRKDFLNKCIKGIESPWEWELYGTKRAWRFRERMYALLESQEEAYQFPFGGAIRRGLWHPEAVRLAEKYGVDIDFDIRGFMDASNPYRMEESYSVRQHFPKDVLTMKFWQQLRKRIALKYRKVICEI